MIDQAISRYESKAAFCRAISMSQQFLWQIERGERPVPARYALEIERATNGAVTVHDLRPDIFGPAPSSAGPQEAA